MEPQREQEVTAYLGLGANLGDRRAQLTGAREALATSDGIEVAAASSLYETAPVGGPPGQEPYLNAVLQVVTKLDAVTLLQRCLAVEARFGRRRTVRWGARTLDIDLLLYGRQVCAGPELILPHPRLHLRRFVLAPLAELAPQAGHPLLGRTVLQLLTELAPGQELRRLSPTW